MSTSDADRVREIIKRDAEDRCEDDAALPVLSAFTVALWWHLKTVESRGAALERAIARDNSRPACLCGHPDNEHTWTAEGGDWTDCLADGCECRSCSGLRPGQGGDADAKVELVERACARNSGAS